MLHFSKNGRFRGISVSQTHLVDIVSLFAAEFEDPKTGIQGKGLTHYHKIPQFDALKIYTCGKHCEKRRNCLNKHQGIVW